jgi:methyl-accepting chemotaxis protein
MEAARLLYGELELDASSALFAVNELDEGFDILASQIVETQDGLGGLDNSLIESSEATNSLSSSFESLGQSLSVIGIFMILAGVLYELISSSESFKKVITELQKAFEPLLKVIGEFAEWVGKYIAEALLFAISLLSEFINYLTKTEQGLALLKVAAIFFAVVAGVALVASLKAMALAAYGAMTAFIAMITPLLPFIAIAAAVAAAITTVILVLEDLYYFATGEGESVAGGFFAMLGMSPEEIEEVRKSIKEFIDLVKDSWESFTSGVSKLAPQLKKIFGVMLAIAKSFFITVFKYIFDLAKIFSGVWDIIKGIFTGNFDLILGGFQKIADGILSIFKSMGNFIADTFNNLLEMIKPIKEIASSLFGGKSPEPIAGARAEGGSVASGKSYLVGEKGAEIFTPSSSGSITPNSEISSAPMGASASSGKSTIASIIGTVNIVVQGGENMASDLSQKIKDVIRQASIEAAQELGIAI